MAHRAGDGPYLNDDGADTVINVTSHEQNETMTDPLGTAWFDSSGFENGDECAWLTLPTHFNGIGDYSQTINGDEYLMQFEWGNRKNTCVGTNADVQPTGSFTAAAGLPWCPGRWAMGAPGWLNHTVRAWRGGRCARRGAGFLARGLIGVPVLAAVTIAAAPAMAALAPSPGLAAVPAAAPAAGALRLDLWGAGLVDAGTGVPLWGRDFGVARPMGSITKVMTALLVIRAGDLGRPITVTKGAIRYVHKRGASSAGLIEGDVLTARQLLAAMLLPSGCDAAYLLATSYGPGRPAFIAKMNAAAQAMGLTATHFSHYDGMPYPTEHSTYSSPADLIRLGEQAMRVPLFRQIAAQRSYHVAATPWHHSYLWQTTDALLGSYRGMLGIKTGNTNAAGNCFLFEARRGRRTLVGVVLHVNPARNGAALFAAARQLLNWGFQRM